MKHMQYENDLKFTEGAPSMIDKVMEEETQTKLKIK